MFLTMVNIFEKRLNNSEVLWLVLTFCSQAFCIVFYVGISTPYIKLIQVLELT